MVRTRIAPSPTGYPHIGTIYQALFDFAYARKNNGKFLVRIEDTDRERFVDDAEKAIFNALDWFGITEDESPRKSGPHAPYRQSERLDIYKKHALELVEKGHAYYCFCTKERLEEVRQKAQLAKQVPMYDKHCRSLSSNDVQSKLAALEPHVIRMKVPESKTITFRDEIRGDVSFESSTVDDQVIMKSDGFPTYHLAVVVDDHLMEVTHIVRGEEWMSSTPKHTLLYEYFGWEKPLFFHTPILRNPDKSKLSKRHSHTNVEWYKENGFLPEAILNYLGLLGWSHPEGKEIFTREEFIQAFDLKDLKSVGPIFDLTKLEWMNGEYIRAMDAERLKSLISSFYSGKYSDELIQKTIPLVQERIKTLKEYDEYCIFFVESPKEYEVDISKYDELFKKTATALSSLNNWSTQEIGEAMLKVAQELGVKNSEYFMAMRVVVTGKKVSPPLNESMELLGKEEVLKRLHPVFVNNNSKV